MSGYPRSAAALTQAHRCPAPGCKVVVSPGHVGCHTHWMGLPLRARTVLRAAFRNRETDPDTFAAAQAITAELMQDVA